MREGEDGMALELETNEEAQGLLAPPSGLSAIRHSPSSTSSRQHLSVTILELSSSPSAGGYGLDSDPEKLSFLSNVSAGGLEPPIVMTPGGASPERRESNNSTRSNRSYAGGGGSQQQQNRSSGSDVVLTDNNSDTYGPGGLDPRALLQERTNWETRYLMKEHRRAGKATFQGQVYNFLERPTGWKCFMYHISVIIVLEPEVRFQEGEILDRSNRPGW